MSSFFLTPLSTIEPAHFGTQLGSSCTDFENPSIGAPALAGLLQGGFRYLSQSLIEDTGVAARADDLLEALERDLSADGFLDGLGPGGQVLAFAGVELDPFILRSRYIHAMTRFLHSTRNKSGFGVDCFRPFFDEILLSRSKLFPSPTWINAPFRTGCASCTQNANGDFSCTTDDCGPCGHCDVDFSGPTPTAACVPQDTRCPGNCDTCVAMTEGEGRFACIAEPSACSGSCSICSNDGHGGFSCQEDTTRCIGSCAACTPGLSDDTVFECLPQPAFCPGNCNTCEPTSGDEIGFSCITDASLCRGHCSTCTDDGDGGFSCQADPQQCSGNCAACIVSQTDPTTFECAPRPTACIGDCAVCDGDGQTFNCHGDIALCPSPSRNATRCNECRQRTDTLFLCEDIEAKCPRDSETVLTACLNENSACALTGVEDVRHTDWQCTGGACVAEATTSQRTCHRNTNGNDCGPVDCSTPFSVCESVNDVCSEEGQRTRTCQQPTCLHGSCADERPVEQQTPCVVNTDGRRCGSQSCRRGILPGFEALCCASAACTDVCGPCEP